MISAEPVGEPPSRAAALSRCQSGRAMREHELRLSTMGLLGLMRIAATQSGHWDRSDLTHGGGTGRMTGDDLAWLLKAGYLVASGRWVEMTDRGNAMVRDLLVFAQEWKGGGEV